MSETNVVGPTKFEEYSEKYKDFMLMTRRNGIIEVRLHTNGGPFQFGWAAQTAYGNAWSDIGRDLENEVMIITGTGDRWQVASPDIWKTKFKD